MAPPGLPRTVFGLKRRVGVADRFLVETKRVVDRFLVETKGAVDRFVG